MFSIEEFGLNLCSTPAVSLWHALDNLFDLLFDLLYEGLSLLIGFCPSVRANPTLMSLYDALSNQESTRTAIDLIVLLSTFLFKCMLTVCFAFFPFTVIYPTSSFKLPFKKMHKSFLVSFESGNQVKMKMHFYLLGNVLTKAPTFDSKNVFTNA